MRFANNALLQDYGGLLDGEMSKNVDLRGKLTLFDISQLPDQGAAVTAVMAIGRILMPLVLLAQFRAYAV